MAHGGSPTSGGLRGRGLTESAEAGGRRRPRRDATEATPGWVLRPNDSDRVFDMVGLVFETHVAAISKGRPRKQPRSGDDAAVGKKDVDRGSRDQTTIQRLGSTTKPLAVSDRLMISMVQRPSPDRAARSFSPA
jgi:hypothetical protein